MKPSRIVTAVSFAGMAALLCLVHADPPPNEARVQGEAALKDRDWAKAEQLLGQALAAAQTGKDEILLMIATAQQNAGKNDEAIATLDRLVKDFPASPSRMKAIYKKGDVLSAKKEFALAAQIYDAQVAAITAPERRKRIAQVYVDAGREFLNPKDPKDPTFVANYQAARNLLVKALELEALGADEEGVKADIIVCEQKGGMDRTALFKSTTEWLAKYPASTRLDEVLFARGVAARDIGRWHDAKLAWLRIADELKTSKLAPEALYNAALLHVNEAGAVASLEELRRALPLLRRLAKEFPTTEWGPKGGYLAGLALASQPDLRDEARKELMAFVEAFPKDERAPEALIRVAWLWRADMDDAKAIASLEDFLRRFPDSPRWPEVRQSIADVRFEAAQRKFARKDWAAARTAALEFGVLHPTDGRAAAMAFRVGETYKEEKNWKEAVEAFMKCATKYPGWNEGHAARFEAAKIMADQLGDYETAMKELPKVGGGSHQAAHQFLQQLQGKAMAIQSEKVFLSTEAPTVKLTVRNVETAKFRVWTLDLKDYFEKKASTSGLETLEVSVIAPDKEWEVPIADYKRFKEFTLNVDLPGKAPGAYIVAASAGTLESRTVVIVSDLAMIARAGRQGATVMVENMRTGEQVPNPDVSIAVDGKRLKGWTPESRASKLSFLVESGGQLAFRDLDVSRLPIPPVRVPTARLLTDRTRYTAGDEVQVRLVMRSVVDGAYVVPKDAKYKFAAASSHGVDFFEAPVTLSASGTALVTFKIPQDFTGSFSMRVFDTAKPSEALHPQLVRSLYGSEVPWARWEVLHDETPHYVGEAFDVVVILRDASGRPLANRKARVMTEGDPDWKDVMTDAQGRVTISFKDTDRAFRDGFVRAWVESEGTTEEIEIPVLIRAPFLELAEESRVTEVVVAGDQKSISFTAKTADDKPFAGAFTWTVIRTDATGQQFPVANGDVTTDAEGKGKFAFTANQAGIHTVTVSRKDADGIPARLQTAVQVVDDTEDRKLRLLSTVDSFEPGKPVELSVLSRLDKGLAFVTLEGEKVDQVLAVTLEKGKNTIKLNPPPGATRAFSVTVMMMKGNAFHTDTREFAVKRPDAKVEAKKEAKPGEEVEVKVTGKPGSEIWLMASPEAVEAFGEMDFRPARPAGGYFAADSSAATSFAWGTQQIDPQLLEALARLENLSSNQPTRVMMEKELTRFKKAQDRDHNEEADDEMGGGGGGGGKYGGRMGGRKNLVARGGGSSRQTFAEPRPPAFTMAIAGADGVATFKVRMPHIKDDVELVAWSVDPTNDLGTGKATIKVRGAVYAEARAPQSAVEGEATSIVVFLTNSSAAEVEVSVVLNGVETKVKVPAKTTIEKVLDWKASATAKLTVDGVEHELKTTLRPAAPTTINTAGGAFTGKTEIKVDGVGATHVRIATSPIALFESLAEGRDEFTKSSDASARLLAHIARHRFEKTDTTKIAVMEFKALQAQNLSDATTLDIAGAVLKYLAAAEAKSAEFDIWPDPSDLKRRFATATSDEVKALILLALSRGGDAEYGFVFRLWRAADSLSPRSLASVAVALKAAKKTDESKQAIERLVKAAKDDHWEPAVSTQPDSANTAYATTAIAAFAMAEVDPAQPLLAKARAWLLARRPSTAFERSLLALAMQSTPDKGGVTEVKVDGQSVKGFGEVVATAGVVEPTGTGTYYVLGWRESGKAPEPAVKVAIKRTAAWPTLYVEGRPALIVPAAVKEPVENPSMVRVAAGQAFVVTYDITLTGPTTQYTVIELPRTTGLRIVSGSWRVLAPPQAEAERTFKVNIVVVADAPGTYAEALVQASGTETRDGWQMTHGERIAAARILFELKKWKEVRDMLLPLFEKGTLLDDVAADAARMLAWSAIELGESATVVRFFEILKEKAPGTVVPFDKIRALAKAYTAMNENERAMQVSSGALDAYFLQEAQLAGALEDLARWKDSVAWMKTLLSDYPDTPLNREMLFGFGQRLYSKARNHRDPAEKNEKLLTRVELLAESAAALEKVLLTFPAHEENDRVILTLCSAYLEAGQYDKADLTARAAALRYPKSDYLDTYDYTQAFSLFAQRKYAEALALCDRLETHDYEAKLNPVPDLIRTQAVLMKAQIFHAKGEIDKALENYKKVKDKSPDAARSIAFLEGEALDMKEVTVAPLAKAAEIELEYAGVAEAQVRAYKVDLTMLALRRKNLVDSSAVEVAGIKPVLEKTIKLDHPNARRREKQTFTLDLKEPGAYLIGIKAGDFFTSGILLRSNLVMGVQEDASGLVRVNISDVASGGFAEGVKVTIFGTDDQKIASDKTDLRGIWETAGVNGLAVVVAEKDGHYAMYRGKESLGQIERDRQNRPAAQSKREQNLQEQQQEMLDAETRNANDAFEDMYDKNVRKVQKGVEVERMKK